MQIAVVSGKGGTGKTAFATSIATLLGESGQILDCDVENPNSYLYMKPNIKKSIRSTIEIPEINQNLCTNCDKCVEACQFGAIIGIKDEYKILEKLCHSCGACWTVCPSNAINIINREYGTTTIGVCNNGSEFVQGELDITELHTPNLISDVKKQANKNKIVVIDGPPGVGCPLSETLKGVDFVLVISEPTMFGYHDFKRTIKLIKSLNLPCGAIINKSGSGNSPIKEYCEENNIPLLLEFPFDHRIAENYSNGTLLVSISTEIKKQIEEVVEKIFKISKSYTKEVIFN